MHLFAAPAANMDCSHCNDPLCSCRDSRRVRGGLSWLAKRSQRRRSPQRQSAAPGSPPERKEKKKKQAMRKAQIRSQRGCEGLTPGQKLTPYRHIVGTTWREPPVVPVGPCRPAPPWPLTLNRCWVQEPEEQERKWKLITVLSRTAQGGTYGARVKWVSQTKTWRSTENVLIKKKKGTSSNFI